LIFVWWTAGELKEVIDNQLATTRFGVAQSRMDSKIQVNFGEGSVWFWWKS
jgi:hypothetical protein